MENDSPTLKDAPSRGNHSVAERAADPCNAARVSLDATPQSIGERHSTTSLDERGESGAIEFWRIWIATFLFFGGFYALLIPFPLYLAACQFTDGQIGMILGAYGVAALVGRPLAGICTDVWGRQPLLLLGTLALIVGAGGVPFTKEVGPLFVLRFLQAVGYVAFTTAATARISDLAGSRQIGSALALFGVSVNLAMTITPLAVSVLLGNLAVSSVFGLSAALAAAAGVLSLGSIDDPHTIRPAVKWTAVVEFPSGLRAASFAAALFGCGFGTFLQFLPILAERRSIPATGAAFTAYGIAIVTTRFVTGRSQDRCDRRSLLRAGFLFAATGLCFLAGANSVTFLMFGATLFAIGSGTVHPGLMASYVELVPQDQRGRSVATFYLAFDLGIGLGTWLLAPVLQHFGLQGLYLTSAMLTAGGSLAVSWLPSRSAT